MLTEIAIGGKMMLFMAQKRESLTLTISVISETSAPNAVNGAPSLFFNALLRCLLCEINSELRAFAHA